MLKREKRVYPLAQLSEQCMVMCFFAIHCRLCTVAGNSITRLGLHSTKIPSSGRST